MEVVAGGEFERQSFDVAITMVRSWAVLSVPCLMEEKLRKMSATEVLVAIHSVIIERRTGGDWTAYDELRVKYR